MSDSALYHPSLLHGGSRETWRTRPHLIELQAELDRTREELATLRATAAQVFSAILTELNTRAVGVAPQIQQLGDLSELASVDGEDPLAADREEIDANHLESLEVLDRRFRWFSSKSSAYNSS